MSDQENCLVVKSNKLIEASYRLTLVEQQIILFAIGKAREEDTLFKSDTPVTISAMEFAKQFGTNPTMVYRQLREAMDHLYKRTVIIRDTHPKSGNPRVTETRWISDKAYIDGNGEIQITFAPRMIPYIARLEKTAGYTKFWLDKIGQMTSAHAVRLYEILMQYVNAKGPHKFGLDELKEKMQLTAEYERTDSFKRTVIDVAVKQINKFSDLKVSYENGKKGRVITHLVFEIRMKPTGTTAPKVKKTTTRKTLEQLGLPEIESAVNIHKNDPKVQAARAETMAAKAAMKRRVKDAPGVTSEVGK